MYARVTTAQVQPGKMEDAVRVVREAIMPAAREQKGFTGALALTNTHTGQAITIGLWETEADLMASEASGFYREALARVADLLASKPLREIYEVSVQA